VGNDTFAVLRSGTERGWGVAVVCGAGINCTGVAPDGRVARFASYGDVSGDWGGGNDIGVAAVSAAIRSEDGRGRKTLLEQAVPATFGLERPSELAEALHFGQIPMRELLLLPPVVFAAAAAEDGEAARIVERLAEEVVAFVRAALDRLGLPGGGAEVVLGGGILQSGDALLLHSIRQRHSRETSLLLGDVDATRAERIRELVKIVQESGVGEIEIEDEGMRVSVRRADEVGAVAAPLAALPEGEDADVENEAQVGENDERRNHRRPSRVVSSAAASRCSGQATRVSVHISNAIATQ
jgi:N-acetylglucosamine kinase-like BadF-type ATPase